MPLRALKILTLTVIAALIALMLYAGEPLRPSWWTYGIPFGIWAIGPAIIPFFVARRFARLPWLATVMLVFVAVSTAASAVAYYAAFFVSKSSTAALVMIFVPLYQWIALGCVGIVTGLLSVWLDRRERPARK